MALRNQPYLPFYVQDYLADEKVSCCSLQSQGVYIRILCTLHKSETYGGILFKQIPKQNFSSRQYFAFILSKQIGVPIEDVSLAMEELLFFEVLKIEPQDGVDFLFQKRMVKDFNTSIERSKAAKKGGGNPSLAKTKKEHGAKDLFKQAPKQKPEDEIEVEDENEDEEKGGVGENPKHAADFIETKNIAELLLSQQQWMEQTCVNSSLKPPEMEKHIRDYQKLLQDRNEAGEPRQEVFRHFANWLRIQLEKKKKTDEKLTRNNAKRGWEPSKGGFTGTL